jgi:2'-5' RNA ligase
MNTTPANFQRGTFLSCFVVLVPAAESLVGSARAQFDDSARRGLGPHITLLYPFMAPQRVDSAILEAAARALAVHEQFGFQLATIGRFPQVAYLKPAPAEPFIALSLSLARAFPQFPPYGGEFDNIVPHLTVAKGDLRPGDGNRCASSPWIALPTRRSIMWATSLAPETRLWHRRMPLAADARNTPIPAPLLHC